MVPVVSRLIGVYDADGTVRGELSYFVLARLGRAHCALCEITHGHVRERPGWRSCRERLPVPFATYHRDDQPADVRTMTGSAVPVVVAETTDGGLVLLADRDDLERCSGSPDRLVAHLESALVARGLTWPPAQAPLPAPED